jgi:hypothetical protein
MPIRNLISENPGTGEWIAKIISPTDLTGGFNGAWERGMLISLLSDAARGFQAAGDVLEMEAWSQVMWRGFIKNDTGSDVVVKIDGTNFNLKDGVTYMCHRQELPLFLQQQPGLEVGTVQDFITDFQSGADGGFTS